MLNYAKHFTPNVTPQTEKASPRQVKNSAGGYTFAVSKAKQLERFLILGSEGGSYYVSERKLTRDNAKVVIECLNSDPEGTITTIVEVSKSGRAPKNDAAIFALALAASHEDSRVRALALDVIPEVWRIGTHLFQFVATVNELRGWGNGLKKGVAAWYNEKSMQDLMYQVCKYGQRDGWSHKDVLRLCHATPANNDHARVFRWLTAGECKRGPRLVKGNEKLGRASRSYGGHTLPEYLEAFEELKTANERTACKLIREWKFTHEMVPSELKNSPQVWSTLLETMPITALIRNLGKLTNIGVLRPLSTDLTNACMKLTNPELIKKGRVHPITILNALRVYSKGHGDKGALTWKPEPRIVDALDAAFYLGFDAIEPCNKNTLLALDISGSMGISAIANMAITAREASAAMAMVTARKEPAYHFMGFGHRFLEINISPRMRLDEVVRNISDIPFGRTDCSLPMIYANTKKLDVDVFQVYTDNETYAGNTHPHQALKMYRQASGRNAKLAVIGTDANPFTIADPNDPGMLDVVGFDTAAPAIIADWARE